MTDQFGCEKSEGDIWSEHRKGRVPLYENEDVCRKVAEK